MGCVRKDGGHGDKSGGVGGERQQREDKSRTIAWLLDAAIPLPIRSRNVKTGAATLPLPFKGNVFTGKRYANRRVPHITG